MTLSPLKQLKTQAEREREQLVSGERPKPRLESRLQGTAVRLLAGFFALMLLLTLVSRAADGVTVPQVAAVNPRSGVLTQRVTGRGSIEPLGDLNITLPSGITVSGVEAEKGLRVEQGDVLLHLDEEDLAGQIAALEEKLRILDLRLAAAASGTTSADTDAVLEAQRLLAEKQEDLARLGEKLTRTDTRTGEDLAEARNALAEARSDYTEAVAKAEKALVKAADEAIKAAQDNLDSVKDSSTEAIEGAQASLESAEDSVNAENDRLDSAVDALSRAQSRLNEAQSWLAELLAMETPDPDAVAAAEAEVESAQAAVNSARAGVDGAGGSNSSSGALKRARDNLKRTKERWAAKVKEAEEKLAEVKREQEAKKKENDVSAEAGVLSAKAALEAAEQAVKTQERGAEDGGLTAQEQRLAAQRAVEEAQRGVAAAEKKTAEAGRTDAQSRRQAEIERLGYLSERRVLQETLDALLRAADDGGRVTAPVSGVVQSILEGPGKTQEGVPVAVLARGDQGFRFTCKVPQEDAEKLTVGDEGRVGYTQGGESKTVNIKVSSIGAADEEGQVTVLAELPEGSYPAGTSGELEVSRRSEKYETCLPLSALRREGEDAFVLVLRESRGVMGIELTVEKVPVKVQEQDSENMAITSDGLLPDDRVVSSASKPVAEGDRVRVAGEEEAP